MKKLMIVDDDAINTQILKWMLREAGLEIIALQTHLAMADMIQGHRPDVIIMDIMLDGANGCELCMALKQDPAHTHIKILLTSANPQYYQHECLADGFLPKPYHALALLERIKLLLN